MRFVSPLFASLLVAAAVMHGTPSISAEVTLKVVSAYPSTHNFNKPLLALIEEVNADGKGIVQLQLIGGPETLPSGEMMQALSGGIVDIFYGASSLFAGDVPEALAQNGSNMSAMELRERGALSLLSSYFEERANAAYLGYFGSGYTFYLYLLKEPERTDDGGVDLSGWKIRGGAPYRSLIDRLGAIMITLYPQDFYSAMERGVIDALAWTSVSVTQDGWDKFVNYRLLPSFWQGDVALVGNLPKWESLTEEQRDFLTDKIAEYEQFAHEMYQEQADGEAAALHSQGVKDIVLEGEAREKFLASAVGLLWDDLKQNVPADRVEALKKAFYKE